MANRATTSGYSGFAGYDGLNTASSAIAFLAVSIVSMICSLLWYGAGLGVLLIAGRSSQAYSPLFLLSSIALAIMIALLSNITFSAIGAAMLGVLASAGGITLAGRCSPRYTAALAVAVAISNAFAVHYIGIETGAPYRVVGAVVVFAPILFFLRK